MDASYDLLEENPENHTQWTKTTSSEPIFLCRNCDNRRRVWVYHIAIYLSLLLNTSLLGSVALRETKTNCMDPSLGYAWTPVRQIVEYVPYTFHPFEDNGAYAGYPDDTKDKLWSDLYNFGMLRINEEEASHLLRPTFKIPDTEEYLIELEVFHQLHCLNQLREAFYPERFPHVWQYTEDGKIDYEGRQYGHWEHCIESIRQSLICHGDVTPITIHYNATADPKSGGNFEIEHTCRNFEKLSHWAMSRSLPANVSKTLLD